MNDKFIEKRLLKMQQDVLLQLSAVDGEAHQAELGSSKKPSEHNVQIDNLNVLFSLDADSRHRLNQINNALNRLYRNEYHRCANCGSALSDEWLERSPLSDCCEDCEKQFKYPH
jgi:RNA polymerase-binding transcription factor DksA